MIEPVVLDTAPSPEEKAQLRRVLLSSYLGSTIEFYDFLLYGTAAALVFGRLFFSNLDPVVGTIASFGTLAAGYVARPLGGIVFGHFGDRIGRKSMLVTTMTIMGSASFLIGLLPTYAQIGAWAPLLLVTLRILQGFALGGEWAGAALLVLERAPAGRRGLASSVTNMGPPTAGVLATLLLTAFATLPDDQFLAWGWRVPFLLSVVLLVVGLWVRLRVAESPLFVAENARARETTTRRRLPLVEVLRRYPRNVVLAAAGGAAAFVIQSLLATFALALAVGAGQQRSTVLLLHAGASLLHIFTIPMFAALSDRVGRRRVMISGALAGAVLAYPIFHMISSGSTGLLFLAFVLGNPVVQASIYGPLAAFIPEMFGTAARYTGASLGYTLATILGAGFAPLAAASLLAAAGGDDPTYVAVFVAVVCVVSAVAILLTRETYQDDLS